jgi:hypothetical protein
MSRKEPKDTAIELSRTFNLNVKDVRAAYANDAESLDTLHESLLQAKKGFARNAFWTVAIPVLTLNPVSLILTLGMSQFATLLAGWTGYKMYRYNQDKEQVGQTLRDTVARNNRAAATTVPLAPQP